MKFAHTILVATLLLILSGCESLEALPNSVGSGLKPDGRVYSGKMSWYSVKTNGGTVTASGEKLSDSAYTAAHRTLQFGTKVKVTNLVNGNTAVVRITDRGPFIRGRIIDVSMAAARDLDFVVRGVVSCKVQVLH